MYHTLGIVLDRPLHILCAVANGVDFTPNCGLQSNCPPVDCSIASFLATKSIHESATCRDLEHRTTDDVMITGYFDTWCEVLYICRLSSIGGRILEWHGIRIS